MLCEPNGTRGLKLSRGQNQRDTSDILDEGEFLSNESYWWALFTPNKITIIS